MSREGVDHALVGLREEQQRISTSLLDLDSHHGYRLLHGARLAGDTWRRWDEAQTRIALLWRLFDAYQRVLDAAAQQRERIGRRADHDALRRLTWLLTGPSVELPGGEVPLEKRTLLGPAKERATLDEAVDMMSTAYDRAADVIAAADAAWSALLVPLEAAEESWRETARIGQSLDDVRHPELDRLGRELTALGRLVRTDPLSLVRDGRPDTSRLDRVRAALDGLRAEFAELAGLRDGFPQRAAGLRATIERVEAVEREARDARETALVKIENATVPEPPAQGTALRERLAALDALREECRWSELARHTEELDRAAAQALEQAGHSVRLSTGLLDRRGELRGRLEAYRAKAGRLGFAEDELLTRLHGEARELLWTAPCDLRRATAAVAEYQRALRACEKETRRA
ncbi:hypothetical protein [Actinomadura barringtoniae]|uniref:hypothetical protein n=1 Tax=Actinomadura barringtoniae TaxID=1427535 RepID=UPI001FB78F4B|nr:hypothetical protein [Actinomadura barringtoniae]